MSADEIVRLVKKMPARQRDRLIGRLTSLQRGMQKRSRRAGAEKRRSTRVAVTPEQIRDDLQRLLDLPLAESDHRDVSSNKYPHVAAGVLDRKRGET